MKNKLYVIIIALVFACFAIVFDTFPRSVYSELEKRELATFPAFSWDNLWSGKFTTDISSWFSDSEPYRDKFMTLSMDIKDKINMQGDDAESVTFHAGSEDNAGEEEVDPDAIANREVKAQGNSTIEQNAKFSNAGIIIAGKKGEVRAMQVFRGVLKYADGYANVCNRYQREFPNTKVYCMSIPTQIEFYCPEQAKSVNKSQVPLMNYVFSHLSDSVTAVDVYTTLSQHVSEPIFLRTDHHWSPLGGYYAARRFAKLAGVPFKDITDPKAYTKHVVHGYVGSMYGMSHDISVKESPEDFVYYTPNTTYTTTYIIYDRDANYEIIGESKPKQGEYFTNQSVNGSYCTFMGGDCRITVVRTNVNNNRRLIILKDSNGNTLPGYLFYSFQEIHVIDYRYFKKNMRNYVRDNKITDILFANNTVRECSPGVPKNYLEFLTQPDGVAPAKETTEKGRKK